MSQTDKPHDPNILATIVLERSPVDVVKVITFVQTFIEAHEGALRVKGVLNPGDGDKIVLQAVAADVQTFKRAWADSDTERISRLTFIGVGLSRDELEAGFKKCATST